jgi:hypothetical protein
MNYFSVCDGIGAAHAALLPLISWIGKRILESEPQSYDCERRNIMKLIEAYIELGNALIEYEERICWHCFTGTKTCENCQLRRVMQMISEANIDDIDTVKIPAHWFSAYLHHTNNDIHVCAQIRKEMP